MPWTTGGISTHLTGVAHVSGSRYGASLVMRSKWTRAWQVGALGVVFGATFACRGPSSSLSASDRQKILSLLARGALVEAKQSLDQFRDRPGPELDELWAKYYLEFVYQNPVSAASIAAVRAIAPDRGERAIALGYIRYSVRLSARMANGAEVAADRIRPAEEALWRGDDGAALRVLFSQLKGERCLREHEWPCLIEQVAKLEALGQPRAAQALRDIGMTGLREKALSAEECGHDEQDACRRKAIAYWSSWEELAGQQSPELRRLRSKVDLGVGKKRRSRSPSRPGGASSDARGAI